MKFTVRTSRGTQKAGKGCGVAFFGLFGIMGLLALIGMAGMVWEGVRSRFWESTSATITQSEIKQEHGDYRVDIQYVYTFNGRTYTGSRIRPGDYDYDHKSDAQRVYNRYRSDRRVTCYVNPDKPEESFLERANPFYALLILIPLVFIAVGFGGIYAIFRGERQKAISERHGKNAGKWALRIFGGVFMLVGGGFTYGIGVAPWLKAREAQNWKEVPCTIISSGVSSHRSSKGGTSYSLNIQYDYVVDGQSYTGDKYNFSVASSGGRKWREEAARAFPAGKETVCYVDPFDPGDAVLVREGGVGWFVVVPGIFFAVGLLIFANAGRATSGNKKAVPSSAPAAAVGGLRGTIGESGGPAVLTPSGSRFAGFIFITIFALFWNAVVFGVLFFADVPTGVKAFLSIFALIGLLLIAAAIHLFLSLFNPLPTVQASANSARLVETIEIRFSFTGKISRIQRLTIALKAEEAATYRRGTDTRTDRHVFHQVTLLETSDPALMQTGTVSVPIPADSMHTFEASNNKITWKLELHGEIPRWPDVKLQFPITVLPHLVS